MPNNQNRLGYRRSVVCSSEHNETITGSPHGHPSAAFRISYRYRALLPALSLILITSFLYGQSTKPVPADGIQYVAANGKDSNDGLSWGTAKASITAAIAALPPCHIDHANWRGCGTIKIGAGGFTLASQISLFSPFIRIDGRGPSATQIKYTGSTGCAIYWTGHDAAIGAQGGGLFDLTVDGASAGAGTCGLETQNIDGFRMAGVTIANFIGKQSVGWKDDTTGKEWNERFHVQAELSNNSTGWQVSLTNTQGSNPTFGYGDFDLSFNVPSGGEGINFEGNGTLKPIMSYSNLHLIFNSMTGFETATAIRLANNALWFSNLVNIHIEGTSTGLSLDSTSQFIGIGSIEEGRRVADSVANGGLYSVLSTEGSPDNGSKAYFTIKNFPASGRSGLAIGSPSDCGKSQFPLEVCEPSSSGSSPFGIMKGDSMLFSVTSRGEVHTGGGVLVSAGTMTLASGTGSHSFREGYADAPVCTATDRTRDAPVKVTSNRTEITVTGPASDVVAWICTPAAN